MSVPAPQPPPRPPIPAGRFTILAAAAAAVLASLRMTEFNPALLVSPEALKSMADFGRGFIPPDLSPGFLATTLKPVTETIQLATAGTALALMLGFPLSLMAAATFHLGGPLFEGDPPAGAGKRTLRAAPYWASRLVLNAMRSIPDLIWALLFVRITGLGPAAGVLGIGVAYAGILGKVFAEIMEGADIRPVLALHAAGATRPQAVLYGVIPGSFRTLLSYSLYRWECAMRAAAILGFVGAGGLGQQIEISMRMFEHHRTATLIVELFLLVALSDVISSYLRRKFG
ncbi:PhnE/PtxC family ABC transporter permease [Nitrospinota bacterium]